MTVNPPDSDPRCSGKAFWSALRAGCRRHGCCLWEEQGETDLKVEPCQVCGSPMISSPDEMFHWCSGDD